MRLLRQRRPRAKVAELGAILQAELRAREAVRAALLQVVEDSPVEAEAPDRVVACVQVAAVCRRQGEECDEKV